MSIRLNAKSIRAAKREVQHSYPDGGIIKGWYEDLDVPDRQIYEANIFKKINSVFRRITKLNTKRLNSKQTLPDYFTFEPHPETGDVQS